jgi:hypothetical protein
MALVNAYRCAHSGLYYSEEYYKEWGTKHGKGMGREPVSLVLDSFDLRPFVPRSNHPHGMYMRPAGVCRAQLDFVQVEEEEFKKNAVILPTSLDNKIKVARIMEKKQQAKLEVTRAAVIQRQKDEENK